jgi:hypothetical protein
MEKYMSIELYITLNNVVSPWDSGYSTEISFGSHSNVAPSCNLCEHVLET